MLWALSQYFCALIFILTVPVCTCVFISISKLLKFLSIDHSPLFLLSVHGLSNYLWHPHIHKKRSWVIISDTAYVVWMPLSFICFSPNLQFKSHLLFVKMLFHSLHLLQHFSNCTRWKSIWSHVIVIQISEFVRWCELQCWHIHTGYKWVEKSA